MVETAWETPVRPMFLLADSQLLFWRGEDGLFMDRVRHVMGQEPDVPDETLRAAYLGASNGDDPAFYDIFVAAMSGINVRRCRMIPSEPSEADEDYLAQADLILLAGGDVKRGWDVFKETGLVSKIVERYYSGAVLMGVSAGAIQLGLRGWAGLEPAAGGTFSTFQIVPYVIDVHDETAEWRRLTQIVRRIGEGGRGLGIPSGGGAIYYPDWAIEPVRNSLVEFTFGDDDVVQALLFPPDDDAAQ